MSGAVCDNYAGPGQLAISFQSTASPDNLPMRKKDASGKVEGCAIALCFARSRLTGTLSPPPHFADLDLWTVH